MLFRRGTKQPHGEDKSFVAYNGRPMIETVLAQVADLGEELFIVTNNPEPYAYLAVPTVGDIFPDHGPLGGIHTAISHASHPHTLIVACDMPWLERPLLQYLISLRQTADVVVPLWDKFPEPLHAVYSKACLPAIEENLKAKRLKITRFYGQVTVKYVKREEIEAVGGTAVPLPTSTPPRPHPGAKRSQRLKNSQLQIFS
ncbi:MAG: molybdenum cofactor guanylyltransferase [Chloroflexi bacterium]|nr:molybdenum cofactor guanylyltransferase [Chloroflexota bacterium]